MSFLSPVPIGLVDGDLSGNLPYPIITGIQNQPIDPRIPGNGYTLIYNGGEWIPTPAPTNTATIFQGVWDANANTPDIENFSGLSDGFIWITNVAGNTNLDGITDWKIGDYAIYSNGQWYQLSNSSFGWGLTGNAGTNPNTNYIGSSDPGDLSIRADAQEIIRVLVGGGVNITGDATITGDVILTNGQKVVIRDSDGFYTALKAGVQSANITYTLPVSSGAAGAYLVTDGSDNLSWKAPISILAGDGLTGGGNITATRTISMPNVGTASTYGSVSQVPVITTDDQGRVSTVTNTSIQIAESQVTGLVTDLSNKADKVTTISTGSGLSGGGDLSANRTISMPNVGTASTYGSVSQVPVITTDDQGRVSAVTNTPIALNGSQIVSGSISVPIIPLRFGVNAIQSITSTTTQISPTGSYHRITNTTGGNITLSNAQASINWTGAVAGQVLIIQMVVVPGIKNIVLTRGATTKLALDGAAVTLSPGASVTFIYDGTLWVETASMNGTSAP